MLKCMLLLKLPVPPNVVVFSYNNADTFERLDKPTSMICLPNNSMQIA